MSALKWIVKEAKHLRRKYPRRFKTWREYVKQASAVYASKHKGKSPVGKKRPKVGAFSKPKNPNKRMVRVPSVAHYKEYKVGSVVTRSKTHTDKNRITANIQVGNAGLGTLTAEIRRRLKEKVDYLVLRRYHEATKRGRSKLTKEIAKLNREINKLK